MLRFGAIAPPGLKFLHMQPNSQLHPTESNTMHFDTDFKVTDAAKITWILHSLKSARQLVSIDFQNEDKGLISTIISVDRKKGLFCVDAFTGSVCHDLALAGENFTLRATLSGVDVTVRDLFVKRVVEDSDGPLYMISLPEELQYVQRRETYRARVTGLVSVPVLVDSIGTTDTIKHLDQALIALSDISVNGCRLEISNAPELADFATGQQLTLKVVLPDIDTPVTLAVQFRHKRLLPRAKLWYVGCQFERLDATTQTIVSQFVSQLQLLERRQEAMFSLGEG